MTKIMGIDIEKEENLLAQALGGQSIYRPKKKKNRLTLLIQKLKDFFSWNPMIG